MQDESACRITDKLPLISKRLARTCEYTQGESSHKTADQMAHIDQTHIDAVKACSQLPKHTCQRVTQRHYDTEQHLMLPQCRHLSEASCPASNEELDEGVWTIDLSLPVSQSYRLTFKHVLFS
ncbi:Hypothetical predicted protein [Pelobates cultripes]|uniref:Uncharacterized protein n=1 Tax=Pelobates cultripes TaxID=61616 RepID=A0AAD1RYR2_PELCU|nr:Hypothetical predicted protein [Pelobates cultripes]